MRWPEVVTARRAWGDQGVATVLVLALAAVLALLGAGSTSLAAVAVARQRAASAADLSALAGAERVLDGQASACARARHIAGLVGAKLLTCSVTDDVVDLVVEVRPAGPLGLLGAAASRARAGSPTADSRRRRRGIVGSAPDDDDAVVVRFQQPAPCPRPGVTSAVLANPAAARPDWF